MDVGSNPTGGTKPSTIRDGVIGSTSGLWSRWRGFESSPRNDTHGWADSSHPRESAECQPDPTSSAGRSPGERGDRPPPTTRPPTNPGDRPAGHERPVVVQPTQEAGPAVHGGAGFLRTGRTRGEPPAHHGPRRTHRRGPWEWGLGAEHSPVPLHGQSSATTATGAGPAERDTGAIIAQGALVTNCEVE